MKFNKFFFGIASSSHVTRQPEVGLWRAKVIPLQPCQTKAISTNLAKNAEILAKKEATYKSPTPFPPRINVVIGKVTNVIIHTYSVAILNNIDHGGRGFRSAAYII